MKTAIAKLWRAERRAAPKPARIPADEGQTS
jgi:hypothetical protein